MTIRALDTTKAFKAQEFARIIFVDDINNYSAKLSDHEPLKQRPAYESLDVPKIVRFLMKNSKNIFKSKMNFACF